jgi:ribosomal protein S18 acetylase RimI-like enzyme
MEVDLRSGVRPPVWPSDIIPTEWQDLAAPAVHDLLRSAYSRGGGDVEEYSTWFRAFTTDAEFDPSLCILAWARQTLAGVALCWSSAFVKDLCVAEYRCRSGLGEALLRAAMVLFVERGAPRLALKVDVDNPSRADRLYRRCGFEVVERMYVDCDAANMI